MYETGMGRALCCVVYCSFLLYKSHIMGYIKNYFKEYLMYQKILTLVSKEYKIQDYMCYPFTF